MNTDGTWSAPLTLVLGANAVTAVATLRGQTAMGSISLNYSNIATIVNNLSVDAYVIRPDTSLVGNIKKGESLQVNEVGNFVLADVSGTHTFQFTVGNN